MTARALYRHYDSKQALLVAAIRAGQEEYESVRRLDGPDAEVRTAVVTCLAELGAQLAPSSTLYARLRSGRDHPRRLVDLGALVVDVCRAVRVLEPAAQDEVLGDLLADVVAAVRATAPTPPAPVGAAFPVTPAGRTGELVGVEA